MQTLALPLGYAAILLRCCIFRNGHRSTVITTVTTLPVNPRGLRPNRLIAEPAVPLSGDDGRVTQKLLKGRPQAVDLLRTRVLNVPA